MNFKKQIVFTLVLGCMFFGMNTRANSEIENSGSIYETADEVLGAWDYSVPGVDPMYSSGIMHITKEVNTYVVHLQMGDIMVPAEDVEVSGNEVKFTIYVEGSRVNVTVVVEGDTMTGSGTSEQGPFTLSGTRKANPE